MAQSIDVVASSIRGKPLMSERINLVAPLPHEGTAMPTTENAGSSRARSGAVAPLIGPGLRQLDVDSATGRSTPATTLTRGARTSAMAIRTTTTRTTSSPPAPSADQHDIDADFSTEEKLAAYLGCRASKRNSKSALAFEADCERNLMQLGRELRDCSYRPGPSICFVVTRPRYREVWAAAFRDRIVHHLLYNRISGRFQNSFVADSCACIVGRGTLYGARRLESQIRSATRNWSRPAYYLKIDIANFFVSIDKQILRDLLLAKVPEPWWAWLTDLTLMHDPRVDAIVQSPASLMARVPRHKRLAEQPAHLGLPIGNLSSQFFANVYLNELDQFIKHQRRAPHYVRYVDDMVLVHTCPRWLNRAREAIDVFLQERLALGLNPAKTILQPVERGVDFVGQVIKPWHTTTRKRTLESALRRIDLIDDADLYESANSYFGLFRQATRSHTHRAQLANAMRRRGFAINQALTKAYRRKEYA